MAKYDPRIIEAAQRSNQIEDMDPDEFGKKLNSLDSDYGDGRGNTHSDNVAGHAFAVEQAMKNLREMLPGMTDYGIKQVKDNVRRQTGVMPFFGKL